MLYTGINFLFKKLKINTLKFKNCMTIIKKITDTKKLLNLTFYIDIEKRITTCISFRKKFVSSIYKYINIYI